MNKKTLHRNLTSEEICLLTTQGCSCDDWTMVRVADPFDASRIRFTNFSGNVSLGVFENEVTFFGGIKRLTGIYHATIHNCSIGNNVYIGNIWNYIANYVIEDNVIIENVDMLAVEGKTSFGNGVEAVVLNEAGGRQIPIFDFLSAHLAYVLAFYRHRPKVIEKILALIDRYTASVTSSFGLIAADSHILNCRTIKNVKFGRQCTIEGIDRLENGSINSNQYDPVYVGPGVKAEGFIISSGTTVSDGTILLKCFVGQGCELSREYSAENSVFFANCGGFHGEAWSIFAGPYTVTYHKSTLLISGYFSFLNAGSGSNQSNHMYKLGPVHQGIVERGSKTTSDSYVLWPAKIGAFTVVMGRHYRNSDTSDLPFSYLIESEDESVLVPAINLRSVGTIRDARKWPDRDVRKDPNLLDFINFNLLSPFTIQKMIRGVEVLTHIRAVSGETSDYFTYNSVKIKNSALNRGIELYTTGITKFLGNCLIKRLENRTFKTCKELQDRLRPDTDTGAGKWVDLAGLFAPEELVVKLLEQIENGTVGSLEGIHASFKKMHENYYYYYDWTWAMQVIQKRLNKTIDRITVQDIIDLTEQWRQAVVSLDKMLLDDAKKEFSLSAQIGFGIDGTSEIKKTDFEEVRGTFESNSLVMEIRNHIARKSELADELLARLKKIKG